MLEGAEMINGDSHDQRWNSGSRAPFPDRSRVAACRVRPVAHWVLRQLGTLEICHPRAGRHSARDCRDRDLSGVFGVRHPHLQEDVRRALDHRDHYGSLKNGGHRLFRLRL